MIRELPCGCVIEKERELLRMCGWMTRASRRVWENKGFPASWYTARAVYTAAHLGLRVDSPILVNGAQMC